MPGSTSGSSTLGRCAGASGPCSIHVGRSSGKIYRTPLDAHALPDGYLFIPMYGPRTDWVKNVLVAGAARLSISSSTCRRRLDRLDIRATDGASYSILERGTSMKAVIGRRFAKPSALQIEDIGKPIVSADGVLVRVHASSANPVDLFLPRRTVLGHDFAGQIEAVGEDVMEFKPGEAVFGEALRTYAEYVCVPENGTLVPKPANVTFEQAAAVPIAGVTALQALRDHGHVESGQKVLVNGASGGVGTFAVQIAKAFGAHVTAACSPGNVDLVASIGADRVIDYTKEDFTKGEQHYDLLLDIAGSKSWSRCWRVLEPNATLVAVGAASVQYRSSLRALGHLTWIRLASLSRRRKTRFFITKVRREDLKVLAGLLEAGKLKPVIDRRYPLDEVRAALNYLREGHAKGKIVLTI